MRRDVHLSKTWTSRGVGRVLPINDMANHEKRITGILYQVFPIRETQARTLQTITNEKWHNP